MSATARIRIMVGAAAVVTAGAVVGVVLATGSNPPQPTSQCKSAPTPLIVPGVPSQAVADVRSAFSSWPSGTIDRLETLVRDHPSDPVVRFNYGVALICRGYLSDADQAFAAAKKSGRNTLYEMRADEILHPNLFQPADGLYPVFQPLGREPLLERGAVLQRAGRQHSAEALYARAARLHPDDDQAQAAAAVGLFDEDDLSRSFSRLGKLTQRFPRSQSVHFHLALLSAWVGLRSDALKHFRLARTLGPQTTLGKQAAAFVAQLESSGTATPTR